MERVYIMMNLLNVLKVNELKEIAKTVGVVGCTKKADFVSSIGVMIKDLDLVSNYEYDNHRFVSFSNEVTATVVANASNLPVGAVVATLVNETEKGFINQAHSDLLFAVETPEEIVASNTATFFELATDSKVFVVDCTEDYTLLSAICGTYVNEMGVAFAKALATTDTDIVVTEFLNYEKASTLFDAIVYTSNAVKELGLINASQNLHGITTETIVIFNNEVIVDVKVADITEENSVLMPMVQTVKESLKSKSIVKPQYEIRKISIDDLKLDPISNMYFLPANLDMKYRTVKMSENRLFRWYHETTNVVADGIETIKRFASNFFIFNAVTDEKKTDETDFVVKCVIADGYLDYTPNPVTGLTFNEEVALCTTEEEVKEVKEKRTHLITIQSASQARQGKYYFSNLDRDVVRTRLVYGHDFGEIVSISKMEARIALGTSSSIPVGSDYSIKVIADRTYTARRIYLRLKTDGSNKVSIVSANMCAETPHGIGKEIELSPTDGQGTIEVVPAVRASSRIGCVSKRHAKYFAKNYTNLSDMHTFSAMELDDNNTEELNLKIATAKKLMKIFNRVPSAFQIRRAGDKGLLVVFPHSEYGYNQDIVMCESMHKYDVPVENEADVELEICSWNKAKKDMAFTSAPFLSLLNITPEDIKSLSKSALDNITENIMKDSDVAMKFLGMLYSIGDYRTEDNKILISKVTKILTEDPTMIDDRKVQDYLKKFLEKFIQEIGFGRIPVKGAYAYIVTDPRFMLGAKMEDCLQSGENYFNNNVDTYVGVRNPIIHSSEILNLNMVADEELWFMKDLIVLNPCDDTLPRAGGADTDGDQILISNEPLLVKSIPAPSYMLYDNGMAGANKDNNWDSRNAHFFNTAKKSNVGQITNLASVHRDLSLHNGNANLYDLKVIALRFIQGWDIDSAKTGASVVIPEDLKTDSIPHHMVAHKIYKGRAVSDNAVKYHSLSPLGQLYDYVQEFIKGFAITVQNEDKTFKFVKNANKGEVARIQGIVKAYEKQYSRDVAVIYEKYKSLDTTDTSIKQEKANDYDEVYSRYQALLRTISKDEVAVACAVYNCAYNKGANESKACSMPWTVCFNGMIQLLHLNNNSTMLVALPSYGEVPETVIVSNSGMLYINDEPVKHTEYIAGVYEVISLEGSHFIKVARTEMVELEPSIPTRYIDETQYYMFKINGFQHLELNPVQALDIIKENGNEFMLVGVKDRTMVVAGGRVIAYYNKESNAILPTVVNVKFRLFENEEPIFVPKTRTAKTVMIDDTRAYRGSIALTAIPVSGITEEEFKVIAEITGDSIDVEFVGLESDLEGDREYVYRLFGWGQRWCNSGATFCGRSKRETFGRTCRRARLSEST